MWNSLIVFCFCIFNSCTDLTCSAKAVSSDLILASAIRFCFMREAPLAVPVLIAASICVMRRAMFVS